MLTFGEFYSFLCLSHPSDEGLLKDSDCVWFTRCPVPSPAQLGMMWASVKDAEHPIWRKVDVQLLFLQNKGTLHSESCQQVLAGAQGWSGLAVGPASLQGFPGSTVSPEAPCFPRGCRLTVSRVHSCFNPIHRGQSHIIGLSRH